MSLLPPEPKTETPAPKEGEADPKADAQSQEAVAAGTPTAPTTASNGQKPTPSKAQQDFEAKLEQLATLDLSVKEQAREVAKAKARLDRYTPLDEQLSKGEIKAAAKAFFGDKYTPDLLLELADDFAPEEISVEERVKRTLEAERKAGEEIARRKGEEKTAADKSAVDTETKGYLGATAEHLRTNKEKYPLICAWDSDPDVNHEAMIDKIWREHYGKTGEVLDPDKVLEQVEARHLARIKKTSFGPKEHREPTLEEHAGNAPPLEAPRPLAALVNNKPVSGADEARARLEAYDREQAQRAMLSYGR